MRVLVTGAARPARGRHRRASSPRSRDVRALGRGSARHHRRPTRVAPAVARDRPDADHQLRRLQRRRRRRGATPRRRCAVNAFGVLRARPRRPRESGAHARALQHRLRLRRREPTGPYTRRTRRIRRASTARRSCSATGSPPERRAPTCCASRACSASRARPARQRQRLGTIVDAIRAATRCRSSSIGPCRPATPPDVARRDARAPRAKRLRRASITASTAGAATWAEIAEEARAAAGLPLRVSADDAASRPTSTRAAPALLRAVEREAAPPGIVDADRGRTRCAAILVVLAAQALRASR